jgi:hypothetical protein
MQPASRRERRIEALAKFASLFSWSCKQPRGICSSYQDCYPLPLSTVGRKLPTFPGTSAIPIRINSSAKRTCNPRRINSSKNMRLKPTVESTDPKKPGGGGTSEPAMAVCQPIAARRMCFAAVARPRREGTMLARRYLTTAQRPRRRGHSPFALLLTEGVSGGGKKVGPESHGGHILVAGRDHGMDNSSRAASPGTPGSGAAGSGTRSSGTRSSGTTSSETATSVSTSSENVRSGSWSPVWYGILGVVFVALLAVLFVIFGSRSVRRDYYSTPPPGGTTPSSAPAAPN